MFKNSQKNTSQKEILAWGMRHPNSFSRDHQIIRAAYFWMKETNVEFTRPDQYMYDGSVMGQCATYPFHSNHLVSKLDWNAEAAKCEGMVPVDAFGVDDKTAIPSRDSLVPEDKIIENVFIEEVNCSTGSSWSYSKMKDIVYGLEDHVLQDFRDEFVQDNWRRVVFESKNHVVVDSHFSGEATGRRALLLKDAPTYVQTEIPFDPEDDGSHQAVVELVQPPHQGMFLGFLQWIQSKSVACDEASTADIECHAAVLGAGCGALPNALLDVDSGVRLQVDAVELDPDILSIGKKYFGFFERDDLKIHNRNALEFIEESPSSVLDAVFLDAASLTASVELTAPPDELCNRQFFSDLSRVIAPGGFMVMNVVGGMNKVHQVHSHVSSAFKHIWYLKIPSQLLLYARNDESWVDEMKLLGDKLSNRVKGLVVSTLEQIALHESASGMKLGWIDQASTEWLLNMGISEV